MQRGGFVKKAKCPKCNGKIYLDSDYYGWFEQCIQCGYTRNMEKVVQGKVEPGDRSFAELVLQPAKIETVQKEG